MTEETRFEKLQEAIKAYGAAAFENLLRCKGFGEAVINGLPEFLGCNAESVTAVPPEGPFDPRRDYGEDAFSYRRREVIALEPVHCPDRSQFRRFRLALAAHGPVDGSNRR